ncbi:hypothetical protein KP509_37G057900 [Ceratopteris richardii]|uniref:Uncharacterized protein n=1 Tax=Ceratopteris richardii TaxID=49495 RepID=A0A8T2Q9P1_CERRI|nr:hypothetical protein KP509_37G057900 [Ceratopteris richardii]
MGVKSEVKEMSAKEDGKKRKEIVIEVQKASKKRKIDPKKLELEVKEVREEEMKQEQNKIQADKEPHTPQTSKEKKGERIQEKMEVEQDLLEEETSSRSTLIHKLEAYIEEEKNSKVVKVVASKESSDTKTNMDDIQQVDGLKDIEMKDWSEQEEDNQKDDQNIQESNHEDHEDQEEDHECEEDDQEEEHSSKAEEDDEKEIEEKQIESQKQEW